MTPDKCLALLREMRSLQFSAFGLRSFPCHPATRQDWRHVITAIDDKVSYLTAVLRLEADPEVVQWCEAQLAAEQQQNLSCNALQHSSSAAPEFTDDVANMARSFRPTIH